MKDQPRNIYKVQKKQWGKWTLVGQMVFNKVYSSMMFAPEVYQHADADMVPTEYFKITAWNAAFEAACICSRGEKHYIKELMKELGV